MEALRAWMLLFVDYIAAKQIIAPALNALVGGPSKVIEASYAPIHKAARARVEGRYQGRRHTETSTQSIYCELLSASLTVRQPRLAAKRQKSRGYPHYRFATNHIDPGSQR
jgi:hypothetical protein